MNLDWDYWFFEVWEQGENAGTEPTHEDYTDWVDGQVQDMRDYMKNEQMMREVNG